MHSSVTAPRLAGAGRDQGPQLGESGERRTRLGFTAQPLTASRSGSMRVEGCMTILLAAFAILLAPVAASATGLQCSIHPKKAAGSSDLSALATLSRSDAQRTALEGIKAPPAATVTEGELEIERGCLVYSFDIRVPGKSGIDEVMVDPGTGKVLSHTHETPRQEAAEQARDQAARSKRR